MRIQLIFLFVFLSSSAFAIDFPAKPVPPRLVNDFAGVLEPSERERLEQKLVALDDSTSVQLAVVILKSLEGYPVEEYAFELAERWGIGQAKTDNGILLLIAVDDRKLFIATGYGTEARLPDALAKRIIENDIKPFFKQGDYYGGIDEGTSRMSEALRGEYQAVDRPERDGRPVPFLTIFIILFSLFAIIFLARVQYVRRYARLNDLSFWTAWHLLNAAQASQRGKWDDFNSGRGGFGGWGGGSFGGGGGGFGGFGGGSFGGGGAGGSW